MQHKPLAIPLTFLGKQAAYSGHFLFPCPENLQLLGSLKGSFPYEPYLVGTFFFFR